MGSTPTRFRHPQRRLISSRSPGSDEVKEALEEHGKVKKLLRELGGLEPSDDAFDDKMDDLKDDVEHHASEEEKEMFPEARRHLAGRLEQLGRDLEARKEALKGREMPQT